MSRRSAHHYYVHMVRVESMLALVLGGVLVILSMVVLPSGLGPTRANYYGMLAPQLKAGSLAVAKTPNCPYDTIEYRGQCYLHWGVIPAFFHWLRPWTDRMASILGAVVAGFFLMKLIAALSKTQNQLLPTGIFLFFGTGLFTAGLTGWVYGESVCLAHAFGLMGVYYFFKKKDPIAGVAIGLSCLTRSSWFAFALVSGLMAARSRRWKYLGLIAVAFFAQAWMNFVRFGNVFEFGVKYYTGHWVGKPDIRWTEGLYSAKAIVPNLLTYFLTGFAPFQNHYNELARFFHANLYVEYPLGLFVTMPVLLVMIPKVFQVDWVKRRGLLVLSLLPMAVLILLNTNQIYRYQLEVWLAFLVVLVPFLVEESRRWVRALAWISAGACLYVTLVNTYWVLVSHWDML